MSSNSSDAGAAERAAKIRIFVALKPPEMWIAELSELQASLKKELRSREVKWVAPEQIHLTLRFFGAVPVGEISAIKDALSKATAGVREFTLRAGMLGCFPSAKRPRVLWLGVEEGAKETESLQSRIQEETSHFGEPPEDRPFSPHLTLARIKELDRESRTTLERLLETNREFQWTGK